MNATRSSRYSRGLAGLVFSLFLVASCLACGASTPSPETPGCDSGGCAVSPPDPPYSGESVLPQDMTLAMATSVMLLDMREPGDPELIVVCSANWIAPDLFLTAHHCAVGGSLTPTEYEAHGGDASTGKLSVLGKLVKFATLEDIIPGAVPGEDVGAFRLATVTATDPVNDLAIMRSVTYRTSSWARISSRPLVRGDRLHACVHHAGLTYSWVEGYVAHPMRRIESVNVPDAFATVFQADTGAFFGSSGGSWLDANDEIVGVMSAIARRMPELAIIVHHEAIRALLATVLP